MGASNLGAKWVSPARAGSGEEGFPGHPSLWDLSPEHPAPCDVQGCTARATLGPGGLRDTVRSRCPHTEKHGQKLAPVERN